MLPNCISTRFFFYTSTRSHAATLRPSTITAPRTLNSGSYRQCSDPSRIPTIIWLSFGCQRIENGTSPLANWCEKLRRRERRDVHGLQRAVKHVVYVDARAGRVVEVCRHRHRHQLAVRREGDVASIAKRVDVLVPLQRRLRRIPRQSLP